MGFSSTHYETTRKPQERGLSFEMYTGALNGVLAWYLMF